MADIVMELPSVKASAKKESLFDEGFLIIITGLGNVFNFYFHIYMSRNLGPENYSALNSLISLLYIISMPIVTIQTTITKFVAQYSARGEDAKVRRLLLESLKWVGMIAFILMIGAVLSAPFIGRFFNIQTTGPIVIGGVLLFFLYLMPVFWAVLQGREQFKYLGVSYFVGFSAKCGLGILFAVIGWGVGGVLFGIVLSFVLAFAAGFPAIRKAFKRVAGSDSIQMKELLKFSLPVVTALFFLSFFCNFDIALVRHFFGHAGEGLALAGYYATASIVGKAFLFLPIGITLALFPKVSRLKAVGENPLPILKRGLFIEITLSLIGILICYFFGRYAALILGKTDAPELISLIKVFGIAITPIAATTILVNYDLALERYGFLWFLLPLTLLTFGAIWFFHETIMSVLLTIMVGGFALFITICVFTFLPAKAKKPLPEVSAVS